MAGIPKYLQVADVLRREIAEGVFRDGQALMTEEELRLRFQVSRQTIRQAISLLENDGLVDRRRGSGTYVRHGARRHQGVLHVGVVTTYITDYIFPAIVQGIENVLNRHGAVMNLSATYNDSRRERNILERMLDGQVDGLIVEGAQTALPAENGDLFLRLAERNIPVLFMNSYYEEMKRLPHVTMDDLAGGRMAATEALGRGYRRIAGLFKTDDLQGRERLRGMLEELEKAGIRTPEERLLRFGTAERMNLFSTPEGRRFIGDLKAGKADCVVCYNDVFAVSLMLILQQEGMKIPEELGLIGFDNAEYAALFTPGLTTLGHPKELFGARVAEKMLRMIEGEREESEALDWTLVERDSLPYMPHAPRTESGIACALRAQAPHAPRTESGIARAPRAQAPRAPRTES